MCDTTIGPGPGAYKLKSLTDAFNYDSSKYKTPQFSFWSRSPDRRSKDTISPGPATYSIKSSSDTPTWSFGERFGLPTALYSPGPADYGIPTTLHHPFGLMGYKFNPLDISTSPGPAQYDLHNLDAYKFRGPHYSMGQLHLKAYDVTSPGPAEYMPIICKNGPSYTFGTKHSCHQTLCYSHGDNYLDDERASNEF